MTQTTENWNVVSMLNWGTEYFRERNIISPRLSIEWLLAEVLGIKRLDLYMQFDRPLSRKELAAVKPLILRRAKHEPLQYITGSTEFFNAVIKVTPDTLIPRPETEQLVEILLSENKQEGPLRILDVGTGSGCIAIAIKKERPGWAVSALEISREALNVAKTNAELNKTEIAFAQGDLYGWQDTGLKNGYDIVVSNPPYITESEREALDEQVKRYEPEPALFTGDIKATYTALGDMARQLLRPGGRLYLETNEHHCETLLSLFDADIWTAEALTDYGNKRRFIRGFLSGKVV
ncbi:MAG: peptide chain release factor N(5)-glutamine methyltransferase [Balneolales bacterium]